MIGYFNYLSNHKYKGYGGQFMKKLISLLLGIALIFTLTACSCSKDDVTPTDAPATSTDVSSDVDSNSGTDSSQDKVESTLNIQESYFTYKGLKNLHNETEVVGKKIDFTISENVTVSSGKSIQPKVATSYSQLVKIYDAANGNGYKDKNYISKYNEEFFVDKAVIMLFIESEDGLHNQYPYTIESVTVSGDSVYVNQSEKVISNAKYPADLKCFRVCIDVNKKDLNNADYLYETLWQIVDDRSIPYEDYIRMDSEEEIIGQSISYKTICEKEIFVSKYNPEVYPAIATTYSDLVDIYDSANITTPLKNIKSYNEAFFNDKAVIIMFERYGRGADYNPCTIKSVTVEGNAVYVNRSIVDLYEELIDYTGQINYYLTIIEINKSDISNAEQLICGFIEE